MVARPALCTSVVLATAAATLLLASSGCAAQNLPLPALPYAYDALAPYIDESIMRLHHLKHHQTYTDKLNGVLQEMRAQPQHKGLVKLGIDALLGRLQAVPGHWQDTLRNHGGGYVNHALFWQCMRPPVKPAPTTDAANNVAADGTASAAAPAAPAIPRPDPNSALYKAIVTTYGTFETFKDLFSQNAVNLFGSGWVWLVLVDSDRVVLTVAQKALPKGVARPNDAPLALALVTTQNQDSPLMNAQIPILALDVWEHAYYLQYQNRRAAYVDGWWHLVNWEFVSAQYDAAQAKARAKRDGVADGALSHDEL